MFNISRELPLSVIRLRLEASDKNLTSLSVDTVTTDASVVDMFHRPRGLDLWQVWNVNIVLVAYKELN